MKKKAIVILTAVISVIATGSVALAASNGKIGSISNPDVLTPPSREEAVKIYKQTYEETPFIIDARTGEHLEKPDLNF
ncbi:hypothetical protein GRF59_26435 [Paenibacillus sp. HJL G12]|uniref:Uncharacterized protein n=1 Tax=Paenibacillus dendrobii TaxID=2691084 RepID=A0A7X3LJE7_9BACL|nr:hypothetical protein [Paenibacillus dendrobii]MWV47137.1 hypothetical protein [Paenibacillus dendrobii]